jgi:hypothetical protein
MRLRHLLLCAGAAGPGCAPAPDPVAEFGPARVVSLATSHGATPMFLVSPEGLRLLSWVAEPSPATPARLHVSVTAPDGRVSRGELEDPLGAITPHGEGPPQLAAGEGHTILALYTVGREVPGRRFPASALRFARSDDGGQTWSAPVSVNEGDVFGSHNFHSLLARGPDVYAAWLSSVAGKSGVWLRHSPDGGRTWGPSRPVHLEATCPCCRTALALAPDGTLYAAWRKIFPGDVRDIVVARSRDRGLTWDAPVKPRDDGWVYPGCPHAGPSLKVDSEGTVHIAWWTGRPGQAGVYYARSTDAGASFASRPVAVGERSSPAHVQLALLRAGVMVVWDDGHGSLPGILLRRADDAGWGAPIRLSTPGLAASFPVIGAWGDSVLVAWTQVGEARHHQEADARSPMSDPNGVMPVPRVGQAEVFVRMGRVVSR